MLNPYHYATSFLQSGCYNTCFCNCMPNPKPAYDLLWVFLYLVFFVYAILQNKDYEGEKEFVYLYCYVYFSLAISIIFYACRYVAAEWLTKQLFLADYSIRMTALSICHLLYAVGFCWTINYKELLWWKQLTLRYWKVMCSNRLIGLSMQAGYSWPE